jgi:hypothetical protein
VPVFRKDGKNILFIHIPKTGGSSIDTVFRASGYEMHFVDGEVGHGTINQLRRCTPQHMHGAMLRQTFKLRRFDVIFMIVRDPIARFRSEYLWRNRKKKHIVVDAVSVEKWATESFTKFASDSYAYDNHLRPQADFLVPGVKVYRIEDGMDSILADLNASYGLDLQKEAPRVREGTTKSGVSSHDVAISPSLEARVKEFYRQDYEQFGYPGAPQTTALARFRRRMSRSRPAVALGRAAGRAAKALG